MDAAPCAQRASLAARWRSRRRTTRCWRRNRRPAGTNAPEPPRTSRPPRVRRPAVAARTDERCAGGFTPEATVAARHANTPDQISDCGDHTTLPHPLRILGRPVEYIRCLETLQPPRHRHLLRLRPQRAKPLAISRIDAPQAIPREM